MCDEDVQNCSGSLFPYRTWARAGAIPGEKLGSIPSQGLRVATNAQQRLCKKSAANYFDCERCVVAGEAGRTDASIEVIELLVQLVGRLLKTYLPCDAVRGSRIMVRPRLACCKQNLV